jgi:hypothetical protein
MLEKVVIFVKHRKDFGIEWNGFGREDLCSLAQRQFNLETLPLLDQTSLITDIMAVLSERDASKSE